MEVLRSKGDVAYYSFCDILKENEEASWLLEICFSAYLSRESPNSGDKFYSSTKGFKRGEFINSGGSAEVYKATLRDSAKTVAAKVFFGGRKLGKSDNYSFRREIRILEKLAGEGNHPNIVQFLGWCIEPRKHIIFLEYVPGGDLYDLLQKDDPIMEDNGVRMRLALDIANGMEYLHSRDPPIYHLDLKPNNVLISERDNAYVCKIADFGLAKARDISTQTSQKVDSPIACGTFIYMSPERHSASFLKDVKDCLEIAGQSDVFSFGMIMWAVRERTHPYEGAQKEFIQAVYKGGLLSLPTKVRFCQEYESLQTKCVANDGAERPSFQEILRVLREIVPCPLLVRTQLPAELVLITARLPVMLKPILVLKSMKVIHRPTHLLVSDINGLKTLAGQQVRVDKCQKALVQRQTTINDYGRKNR
ncbi:probable serine/threonine-protein kinase drkD [Oscarella lobularis]|uniref:probable serine/threonine-protein kinase drkD n=1 Tax=Oscarella lobularis TaxID=121494 RepID=UPI0033137A11